LWTFTRHPNIKKLKLLILKHLQLVLNMLGVDPTHENNGSWDRVSEFLGDDLEERRYEPQSGGALGNSLPITLSLIALLAQIFFSFYCQNGP
jgi:hypothetical protein